MPTHLRFDGITRRPLLPLFASLVPTLILAASVMASTGPTTPTFLLKWGNPGSATGQFLNAAGVAVDAVGNVYVADDNSNSRIQKFDAFGNFIMQWGSHGSGDGQFNGVEYIAIDASGNLYVTDYANARVQVFTSNGVFLRKWGTSGSGDGQFNGPEGIALDAAGNVYVADGNNARVQKFTSSGTFLTKWGTSGNGNGQFQYPAGVAVDKAGNVYVGDYYAARVQKFTNTGTYLAQWGSPGSGNGQFNQPGEMAFDALGNLYVVEYAGQRVQKFAADGTYLTQWGALGTGDGQFNGPWGLAVDAAGDVYVAEWDGQRVQKFSGAGAALAQAPPAYLLQWGGPFGSGDGELNHPWGLATDASGNVYVDDFSNSRVEKFSSTGTYVTQWPISSWFLATDNAGNVYVSDISNKRIQKFSSTGVFLMQWGSTGSGDGQFSNPQGVATDAAGSVYVADPGNQRIQKFTNTGGFLGKWGSFGSGNGQFISPYCVCTDPAGNVYVSEEGNHRVQKFTSAGAYITQWGGLGSGDGQFNVPDGLATDAAGNVYVADSHNHRVQKFTSSGVYLTQWGVNGTANGQFDEPKGIALDAAGNLYVSDWKDNRVQKFVSPAQVAQVFDVGNDQGKQAQLRVLRSSADSPDAGVTVTGYEIYRRDDPLPGAALVQAGGAPMTSRPAGVELDGWTYVGSFPAHGETAYSVVVPTLANSNASSLYYTAFMARAVTASPFTFYDSGTAYGYSIDNLSPPVPSPFTAAYLAGSTNLHWGVSSSSDFAIFRLYRGSSSTFTPSVGNQIAATTDTGYVDPGPAGSYYKLTAVDLNGNPSPYALVGPAQTTSVPGAAPLEFALEGVWPNPVSGHDLTVRFVLPVKSAARLELLDVQGRIVVTRDAGALGIGRHAVNLTERTRIPAGLYFVRLRQGANEKIARVTVLD